LQAPVTLPLPCETAQTATEEPSETLPVQTRPTRRRSFKRTLSESPPPVNVTHRKARKLPNRTPTVMDEKNKKWWKYFDVLTSYQLDISLEIDGDTACLGTWLQQEKNKMDFYYAQHPDRFSALAQWFMNELLSEQNELSENSLPPQFSSPLRHSVIDLLKNEDEDPDFSVPTPTVNSTDSSLTLHASSGQSSVLDLQFSPLLPPLPAPVSNDSIFSTRTETMGRNEYQFIEAVIAFKKETFSCCYINFGRIIDFVDQKVIIQRFHVSSLPLEEAVLEETNERIEISSESIFMERSQFITFELKASGSKLFSIEIFFLRIFS
jgi:uncharacterized protein YfcZ (UPF0381/DUF406 family)